MQEQTPLFLLQDEKVIILTSFYNCLLPHLHKLPVFSLQKLIHLYRLLKQRFSPFRLTKLRETLCAPMKVCLTIDKSNMHLGGSCVINLRSNVGYPAWDSVNKSSVNITLYLKIQHSSLTNTNLIMYVGIYLMS